MKKKKILWAPWRVRYITNPDKGKCVFCQKSESTKDEKNYIIYRGKTAFALLNIYPYNNGHTMVAPYKHIGDLLRLPDNTLYEMLDIVKYIVKKVKKEMHPHGFNIGMNIGRPAGAGYDKHLHIHVVPRWSGDTSFMPVISAEDVISESLESVHKKLKIKK